MEVRNFAWYVNLTDMVVVHQMQVKCMEGDCRGSEPTQRPLSTVIQWCIRSKILKARCHTPWQASVKLLDAAMEKTW